MKGDQDWVQTPPQDFRSLCQRQSSFYLPTSVLNQDFQDFLQALNTFPSEQNKLLSIDLQNISLYSEFYQSKYQLVYFWTELTGGNWGLFSMIFRISLYGLDFHQEFMRFFLLLCFAMIYCFPFLFHIQRITLEFLLTVYSV